MSTLSTGAIGEAEDGAEEDEKPSVSSLFFPHLKYFPLLSASGLSQLIALLPSAVPKLVLLRYKRGAEGGVRVVSGAVADPGIDS